MKTKVQKLLLLTLVVFIFSTPLYSKDFQIDINEKTTLINLPFWEKFEDDFLIYYIVCAIKNNHKAKSAIYKSEELRQEMKMTLARQFPTLSVASNYLGVNIPSLDNFQLDKNGFILPFQFRYEADLLLKNKDKTKSKNKLYKAQKQDENTAYIVLASDVATAYINILKFDKTIELQEKLIKNKEDIFLRTKNQFKQGIVSKSEQNDKFKELISAQEELEELKKQRKLAINNLKLLLGDTSECDDTIKRADFDKFANNINPPNEINASLIYSRPDVLSALYKLESAKINIKIAKKDFLPTFNINGFLAFDTFGAGNFFAWSSSFAALIAGATQDIFRGGEKIANLKYAKARYGELFELFLQANLTAMKEVNDSLYKAKCDFKIYNQELEKYQVEKNNLELEDKRFSQGTKSFIDLAQQSSKLIISKQSCTLIKAQKLIDMVSLYKSVGGAL